MKIIDCVQGEAEWLHARAGRVTASRVADAIAVLKRAGKDGRKAGESSAVREAYKAELVAEILSGSCAGHFVTPYMERGTALEPDARAAYELKHGVLIEQVGFVVHPTIDRAGASPDGLIGRERGVEFKVPKIETHLRYMLAGVLPPEYEPQVMWNLACAPEIPVWDFVSFCPELPERHQQFRIEVYRDFQRIEEIEAAVRQFLAEVDDLIERLNVLNPEPEQLNRKLRESVEAFGDLGLSDADLPQWWMAELAHVKTRKGEHDDLED